jgi:cholesterol oxidase
MNRLSSSIEKIKSHYDVVVIGSGYGGAIAASRLSRAGKKVCVLERGKERQPGEYPETTLEAAAELQVDNPECHIGSRSGMYDLRVNRDISVVVGCGLGGTSLINANVSFRPAPRVFDDPSWPSALRAERLSMLEKGFSLAEQMLGANPYPSHLPTPPKLSALQKSAESMGQKFYRPPINVTFTEGVNFAGVRQSACTLCGDCCSGCNAGAKNTVLMNYLPDAKRHGAEIFVETSVRYVERGAGGGWLVHYQVLNTGREAFDTPTLFVTADIVILAAGALGSTEILLRSKAAGKITASDRLGQGFSGNGDVLGFGYNGSQEINGIGLGRRGTSDPGTGAAAVPVGPTITGVIDMRGNPELRDDMIIEEGAIPGALASTLCASFKVSSSMGGVSTALDQRDTQAKRELETTLHGPYRGAIAHTQTYLVMGHEQNTGTMKLEDDRLRIDWPGVGAQPLFAKMNERLRQATKPLEGIYTANPAWNNVLRQSLVTVHPLGGCNMADSAETGVVDHRGKVFSSTTGTDVHEGLYVCDGAIIPTAVGVNPLLTISALSERCCMIIAEERGLTIDYASKGPMPVATEARPLGIQFTERMAGHFSQVQDGDFQEGDARGKQLGSSFEFVLTIVAEDLRKTIDGAEHEARMMGTVVAPTLSPKPLLATQGIFNLFVQDPKDPGTRLMKYRMRLLAQDGRLYYFTGFKVIRDRPIWELWRDTTTLFITIHEGEDESGPVVGKGILRISAKDFTQQLGTLDVLNAKNAQERLSATAEFGQFFAGVLYENYGGVAVSRGLSALTGGILSFSDGEEVTLRKRRPLRAPEPEFVPVTAPDGVELLLTRYRDAGRKGPVIVAHGLGTSSRMFTLDTVDTNLLEYLVAADYDVWLFDYRSSVLLPGARSPHTADDVARKDWPTAVARVRELTGAESVKVIAHCFGGTTFSMAMLAGLQGIRSAVCLQGSTHLLASEGAGLRTGLYAAGLRRALGISSAAEGGSTPSWSERYYERALSICPQEEPPCDNEACQKLGFLYSRLYEHARLDPATHAAMTEIFGEVPPSILDSLARIASAGFVVGADGEDAYLPHLERMALPIRFIHGAENACFLPASTQKTFEMLSARNGAGLYTREVIAGYGHHDTIFGKTAAVDVYPKIIEHLSAT